MYPHWPALGIDPTTVLEHLWESSLVGLTLVTEEGKWLHPSPALCELLEYTAVELEQKTYMDVTHPEDVNDDMASARAVADGSLSNYVMAKRYITKTGRVIWIKLHVSGFFDEHGQFLMYLSQVAPAERWDPHAPVVRVSAAKRVEFFFRDNWKWLLGGGLTAAAVTWDKLAGLFKGGGG